MPQRSRNGFTNVRETDGGGWCPLHYAAMGGDPEVLRGLLELQANPNRTTRKDQPLLGAPAYTSPLAISLFHRHVEASKVLIKARAALTDGFISTPLVAAAAANNPEGVRLLCDAGCPLQHRNLVGHTAFEQACCYSKLEAVEELLAQAARAGQTLDATAATRGLQLAMADRGGSVALVQRLVELRADVNDQSFGSSDGFVPLLLALLVILVFVRTSVSRAPQAIREHRARGEGGAGAGAGGGARGGGGGGRGGGWGVGRGGVARGFAGVPVLASRSTGRKTSKITRSRWR